MFQDMKKFGGPNKIRQKCRLRQCKNFVSLFWITMITLIKVFNVSYIGNLCLAKFSFDTSAGLS